MEIDIMRVENVNLIVEFVTRYQVKALKTFVIYGPHGFIIIRHVVYFFVTELIDALSEAVFICSTKSLNREILLTIDNDNLKYPFLF